MHFTIKTIRQKTTYSLFPCTFLTSSFVLAMEASIFPKKRDKFSSSESSSCFVAAGGDFTTSGGGLTGVAVLLSGTGIKRYSLRNKLSLAHSLFALLICSIYRKIHITPFFSAPQTKPLTVTSYFSAIPCSVSVWPT